MSILRATATVRHLTRPTSARPCAALFSTGGVKFASQESSLHDDDRAQKAEFHKADQLQKQKEGKGHWTPELASDSESAVKADRDDIDVSKESIKSLQQETEKHFEKDAQKKGN